MFDVVEGAFPVGDSIFLLEETTNEAEQYANFAHTLYGVSLNNLIDSNSVVGVDPEGELLGFAEP